jgi:hypothetical protein
MNFKSNTLIKFLFAWIIILISGKISLAKNLNLGNTSVDTNDSTFVLSNLNAEENYSVCEITGNIQNNTNKNWVNASFNIIFYDKKN